MSTKLLQESFHPMAIDVLIWRQGKIKSYPTSLGGYGKSGNGRNLLPATRSLVQQRSLSSGGPNSDVPMGSSTARIHPEIQEKLSSATRFFYLRPVLLNPTLDSFFISLLGSAFGFLWSPTH